MTTEHRARIAEYRASKAINASTIKAARISMLHAKHAYDRVDGEPTAAMELGSAVHAMLSGVEPVIEYAGRRAGAAWEAFESGNVGAIILPPASFASAKAMAESGIDILSEYMAKGNETFENPIYWQRDEGVRSFACRALPDFVAPGVLIDFKTVGSKGEGCAIEPRKIERASYDSGWHIQLGWYVEGLARTGNAIKDVFVLAIESKPPHDAIMYRMDDDAVDRGRREAIELASDFADCLRAGTFPGIARNQTLALALPPWVDENTTVDFTDTEKED